MPLRYLGHSAIEIYTGKQKRVLIDPWLEGNPSCPESCQHPENVDLIVLSHGHEDHASGVVKLANRTGAKVCANWELGNLLAADGLKQEQIIFMNKGGWVEEQGIGVFLTHAFHSSSYRNNKGSVEYAGEASGILLRLESGRIIYHAGDTTLFSDMKMIGDFYKPDIALLPIGGCFTMGIEEAAIATQWIRPRVVIPIHYNTFPSIKVNVADFEKLASPFAQVVVLNPSETYEASKNFKKS